MARLLFWFAIFATLTIIPILVESESKENLEHQTPGAKLQTPGGDVKEYSSTSIKHVIMNPKSNNARCTSELKMCGTVICVIETNGSLENLESDSQSSIRDVNNNQASHEYKKCFCNNNEVVFVRQEEMEVADTHYVKFWVRELNESGCKDGAYDWKLTVFTRYPYLHGRHPDVIGCMSSNTCMVVCDMRDTKIVQNSYDFIFMVIMALPSIVSIILCITLKYYMRKTPLHARNQPTVSVEEAFDLASEYEDIRHYSQLYDRFSGKYPLRPRMRLQRR